MKRLRRPAVSLLPALLLALGSLGLASGIRGLQVPAEDSDRYEGREIAGVMSYRGAPWLERSSREVEEDPDALHAHLAAAPGDAVVDLGCGSGYHARRLARAVGPEGTVYCVDIQSEMLSIARELAEDEGLENLVYVLSKADDPELPNGTIDLILLVDVYHEFERPAAMLREMRRALAPDGRIALVEYRLEGDSARHIKREHRMSRRQVLKEWLPAGYALTEHVETLPTQHLFFFEKER